MWNPFSKILKPKRKFSIRDYEDLVDTAVRGLYNGCFVTHCFPDPDRIQVYGSNGEFAKIYVEEILKNRTTGKFVNLIRHKLKFGKFILGETT